MRLTNLKRYLIFAVPLLAVLGVNIYVRIFPINFPQLKTQARDMVKQGVTQRAAEEVYSRFPQYDPLAKDKLIKSRIAEYYKQNAQEFKRQAGDLYRSLKDRFQDKDGQPYLMELDCWHWSRYVENAYYKGHPGDVEIAGRQLDTFMLAPQGMYLHWDNFLYYFAAFLYRILSFFKYVPIFTFTFYLPLLITSIFITVLYLFAYRHGGHIAGIISSILVGLSANFIPRSCVGWFDKDVLNLLFPVLILWTYPQSYTCDRFKTRIFWICLSAFWTGLFCFSWVSWWFVVGVVLGYEALSIAALGLLRWYYHSENLAEIKKHLITLALYLGFNIIWTLVFCGFEPFIYLYRELMNTILLSDPLAASIWPNVFSTVGELKRTSLSEIIEGMGGKFVFFPALASMFIILTRNLFYRRDDSFKHESIIMLSLWFLGMLFASIRGVRFLVFLSVPLSVSLGWAVNDEYEYFKKEKRPWEGLIIALVIISILGGAYFSRANKVARSIYPLMNDMWYKVLTLIKDTTPKEAVVNSWWDFGDWFKVVGRRRVIFDGQSQNAPQAHWMARAILSNNEEESIAILRMLNNGANRAFEVTDEYVKNPLQSVLLLENVMALEPGKAKEALSEYLPASAATKVAALLFGPPPSGFFVVDPSLVGKITAISYLGNWNFAKVYIVKNFDKMEKDQIIENLVKLGKNAGEMERLYQEAFLISGRDRDNWISQPVQFFGECVRGQQKDGEVFFENGFIYNIKERTAYANNGQIPRSLFIFQEDRMLEVVYPNANVIFSILVYQDKDGFKALLLDRSLANSLFVRLYFLRGQGLKHFKTHIDAQEGSEYVGVYKIEW